MNANEARKLMSEKPTLVAIDGILSEVYADIARAATRGKRFADITLAEHDGYTVTAILEELQAQEYDVDSLLNDKYRVSWVPRLRNLTHLTVDPDANIEDIRDMEVREFEVEPHNFYVTRDGEILARWQFGRDAITTVVECVFAPDGEYVTKVYTREFDEVNLLISTLEKNEN